jgi:putative transcriptional regulator
MDTIKGYKVKIEYSDADGCYIGTCSDLFAGGCHAETIAEVREELAIIIEDLLNDCQTEGTPPPAPSVRTPRMAGALKARQLVHLNQRKFAMAIGVAPATVRNWEQGRVQPKGSAKVLLDIIERNPHVLSRDTHSSHV